MQGLVDEFEELLAARPGGPVERIETHISWVLLAGDRAYKLKKPVRFEFLDYTSLAARKQACEDEVRLNRRLAPQLYLGVVPIARGAEGRLVLGDESPPEAAPLDWVVEMRRLDEPRTLDNLLVAKSCTAEHVERLAELLTAFYSSAERVSLSPEAYRAGIFRHVQANRADLLATLPPSDAPAIVRIHGRQLESLALAPEWFDERVAQGRIVDGHGDLRPEHVYFPDAGPPLVFDCIEFSAEFRTLDVADELGFLAMECDALSAGWFGQQCLARCLAALEDRVEPRLLAFYKSYRACVRAKVAALRAAQLTNDDRRQAREAAERYLRLADGYLDSLDRPRLLAIRGLMGTGKTTLARALAERLGALHLSTDAIRRERLGTSPSPAAFGEGHYAPRLRQEVYAALIAEAQARLSEGASVVLDGAFLDEPPRQAVAELAEQSGVEPLWIECHCPDAIARQRISRRQAEGTDASEGRVDLYDRQRELERPIPGATRVDTTGEPARQVEDVLVALRRA